MRVKNLGRKGELGINGGTTQIYSISLISLFNVASYLGYQAYLDVELPQRRRRVVGLIDV